jgi:hypothetical protein
LTQQVTELLKGHQAPQVGNLAANADAGDIRQHLDKLSAEYDDDFVAALNDFMDVRMKSRLDSFEKRLAELGEVAGKVDNIAKNQAKSDQEKFQDNLTNAVPEWRKIMESTQFKDWANSNRERFSGSTYAEIFDRANNDWSLQGMVAVFEVYREATGAGNQQQPGTNQPPAQQADSREGLITPPRRGSQTVVSGNQQQAKIWKESEVNAFWRSYADYKPEVAAQMESDIFLANMEGRIVPG